MAYRNTKRDSVKALLKNENMGKIIRDALDSPIGSTPRKRAQKIVSILRKLNKYDGAGGPGIVAGQPPQSVMPTVAKKKIRRKVRIFNATPKMGKKKATHDGAGGMGDLYGGFSLGGGQYAGAFGASSTSPIRLPSTSASSTNPFSQTGYGSIGGINTSSNADLFKNQEFTGLNIPPQYKGAFGTSSNMLPVNIKPAAPFTPVSGFSGNQSGINSGGINTTTPRSLLGGGDSLSGLTASRAMIPTPRTQTPATPGGQTPPNTNYGSGPFQGPFQESGATSTGTDTTSGSGTDFDQLISGFSGPSSFAQWAMQSVKNLRQVPGFEGVRDEDLPHGASLSGQLNALWDATRFESGMDDAMLILEQSTADYNDLLQGGVGLNTRITDYIRRRDEYLNHTTGMLKDFEKKTLDGSMNMADPHVARMAQSYAGYLGTLQGRQNKRYVEWMNSSITAYGQQIEATAQKAQSALSIYDRKASDFKNRYETGEKIAIAEYEELRAMLVEAYNTASGLPSAELELDKLRYEVQGAQADALKKTNEAIKVSEGLSPERSATVKFLKDNFTWYDEDSKQLTRNARNLPRIIQTLTDEAGEPSAVAIDTAIKEYTNNLWYDWQSGTTSKDALTRAAEHLAGLAQFYKNNESSEFAGPQVDKIFLEAKAQVMAYTKEAVLAEIKNSPTLMNKLKEAVGTLVDPRKWMGLRAGDVPSRSEFISKYVGFGLPAQLLSGLYYEAVDAAQGESKEEKQDIYVDLRNGAYADKDYYSLDDVRIEDMVDQVVAVSLDGWGNVAF